jgi:meso-butanediol dehydrogenase/(S,S)-butanediol dehydrogenase/diacetyl reductase
VTGRLDGRVAVVTAAGSGIGLACARRFAAEGATVVVNALHEESAEAAAAAIRERGHVATAMSGDVSDPAVVQALVDHALARFGRLDVMHNNAALPHPGLLTDVSDDEWRRVMSVTLDSVFYGLRATLPSMIDRGSGSIINTTSSSGLAGTSRFGSYGAAKAAVEHLTRVAAVENARYGVRINAICPGTVESRAALAWLEKLPGGRRAYEAQIPQRRVGLADEVAHVAVFLASDDASYVNGATIMVDGGVAARVALPLDLGSLGFIPDPDATATEPTATTETT